MITLLLLQESDLSLLSVIGSVVIFILWIIFFGTAAAKKKVKQDEAYAKRKGISYERLLQNRANINARKINKTTKEMVFRKYNYECNYCGDTEDLHIDHIFPFSKYRDNSFWNLQILCRDCNMAKFDKEPDPKLHPELFGENLENSMAEKNINIEGVYIEIKNDGEWNEAQLKSLKKFEEGLLKTIEDINIKKKK